MTSNLGALPTKANTINLETPAMGWGEGVEWRVESMLEDQHGKGRAGAIGEESAVRGLKLQKSLSRGGGLKMQDVRDRVETEEKGRRGAEQSHHAGLHKLPGVLGQEGIADRLPQTPDHHP